MRNKKIVKYNDIQGNYRAERLRFGIIVSRFNEYFTNKLRDAAVDTLISCGAKSSNIHVIAVPGAFELPLVAQRLVKRKKVDAVIALAVVIKGETKHFEQVVEESARGLSEVSLKSEIPVILGIIPAMNIAQVTERVGVKQMNKGREWALSAIEMATLMKQRGVLR